MPVIYQRLTAFLQKHLEITMVAGAVVAFEDGRGGLRRSDLADHLSETPGQVHVAVVMPDVLEIRSGAWLLDRNHYFEITV